VADYFYLFVNRRAYTPQSDRPHAESGRHYYFRPSDKKTGQGLSLTLDTIRRHIKWLSDTCVCQNSESPAPHLSDRRTFKRGDTVAPRPEVFC